MKKQELSETYNISIKGVVAWKDLSEEEMFETLRHTKYAATARNHKKKRPRGQG